MKYLIALVLISCAQVPVQKTAPTKYERKEWHHWSDFDRDCQNTRHEILISRSLIPVSMDRRGCNVMSGKWNDYYYPEVHTSAFSVDIDHLIPLKHAHEVGGYSWTKQEKEKFANDPDNLVITNKKYNRKKGAKTIGEWLPSKHTYACKYIKDWIRIKKKYNLPLTPHEEHTISQAKCPK